MAMTPGDSWLQEQHEALKLPSFIKKVPTQFSESSASWLIEKLSELSEPYTGEDLNAIYRMLQDYWVEYTAIEAEEEIANYPNSCPIIDGIIAKFDYKEGLPSAFYIQGDEILIADYDSVKDDICWKLDEIYISTLERFQMIREFTDWAWKYTSAFGDEVEIEEYEVAIVVALETLGFYLQQFLENDMKKINGAFLLDFDEVHQTHHLARELKSSYELNKLRRDLLIQIPKEAFSERASKGGRAKSLKRAGLKQYLFDLYEIRKSSFGSIRKASIALTDDAKDYCEKHNIDRLAPSNAQRTIYEWLRRYERQKD